MTVVALDHEPAVIAEGLHKTYPGGGPALVGLDLEVAPGTVHGLLGPNGAGKTTTVRILATLLRPDAGRARVAGHDVSADPAGVRARIGVAGQYAAVDEVLTGRQNLEIFARLHRIRARDARRRATALLERFELEGAADLPVRKYSGGMRRRLDLAVSLIRSPLVLFLDEPTTGLDPRSRNEVWSAVRELAASGTTVVLTTQYLEEADRLSARISLIDQGRVIADGSPADLKARAGGARAELVVPIGRDLQAAAAELSAALGAPSAIDPATRKVSVPVSGGGEVFTRLAAVLERTGLSVRDLALVRPDLDEVFLQLTGGAVHGGRR